MVLNAPSAMNADTTEVELLAPEGTVLAQFTGDKRLVARSVFAVIQQQFLSAS